MPHTSCWRRFWAFSGREPRLFIQAPSGHQRFNVLGALNTITHQVFTVTNQTYITAVQVCEVLTQLAALERGVPLTVVLDTARYQRGRRVLEHTASLGIELLFLPPYSPNLNLIERFWKFVKKHYLYSKYYEKFEPFKQAISDCLAVTSTKYKNELKSLLTLNFQSFEKTQIVTV
jgi:transposase